jgi:hypothetical protein
MVVCKADIRTVRSGRRWLGPSPFPGARAPLDSGRSAPAPAARRAATRALFAGSGGTVWARSAARAVRATAPQPLRPLPGGLDIETVWLLGRSCRPEAANRAVVFTGRHSSRAHSSAIAPHRAKTHVRRHCRWSCTARCKPLSLKSIAPCALRPRAGCVLFPASAVEPRCGIPCGSRARHCRCNCSGYLMCLFLV